MKASLLALCLVTLSACGPLGKLWGKKEKDPYPIDPAIKEKAELYIKLASPWGHKCDGVGFMALGKLAGAMPQVNVFDAEGPGGRWYRTPSKDCFDKGESASDISKDMFTMLFPYLYKTGDKDALKRIFRYGKNNNWIMGRGPISRTLMTPPMIIFLGEMIGEVPVDLPDYPDETTAKAGYEKHLDAISWLTQGMVRGFMDLGDFETLTKYAKESPRNALFQALKSKYQDGDQSKAIAILLDESLFPKDRLPSTDDRCEEYLWQRDDKPSDWEPCNGDTRLHDGIDYILAAWIAGQI